MSALQHVRLGQTIARHDTGWYWYMAGRFAERRSAAMKRARKAKREDRRDALCLIVKHAREHHRGSLAYIRKALQS